MSLYVIEFRLKKRPMHRTRNGPWRPALGMFDASPNRRKMLDEVEAHGSHDNCEYRAVRYVRAPKRRPR